MGFDRLPWPPNLSRAKITLEFDPESFNFIEQKISANEIYYNKEAKSGGIKRVCLKDYLLGKEPEHCRLTVEVTEKGGFHFPEFFRKTNYEGIPDITRIYLEYHGDI